MTTIGWKSGLTDVWNDPAAWSGGAVPGAADSVSIAAASLSGAVYDVTIENAAEYVSAVTQNQAQSMLLLQQGTLAVSGTYTLNAGSIALTGGTLQGGTYASSAGSLFLGSYGAEYANGVTFDGNWTVAALPQSYNQSLSLNGVQFHGLGGTGSATITVGTGVGVGLGDSPSVNNVVFVMGANTSLAQQSGTLTIGAQAYIATNARTQVGVSLAQYGGALTTTINGGLVAASGTSATLSLNADIFINQGLLAVSNGGTVLANFAIGSNSGVISVGAGSYMRLGLAGALGFSNSGSVQVAGGTLSLGFGLTTAQLAAYAVANGTLGIAGTLNNMGATLVTGPGTPYANILLDGGSIMGGTIVNAGQFAIGSSQGYPGNSPEILSGVTFDGRLGVDAAGTTLTVANGLIATGVAGSGTGTIVVDGANAGLAFTGVQTLNNVVLDLGGTNPADTYGFDTLSSTGATFNAASTLTLGSTVQLVQTGQQVAVSGYGTTSLVVNDGTISAGFANGTLALGGFLNDKLISVSNNDTVELSGFANAGTIEVAGGTVLIDGGSANGGLVSLGGSTSIMEVQSFFGAPFSNAGTLDVSNGATASLGIFGTQWTNTGTINVAGGDLSTSGSFALSQLGTINFSQGGTLDLGGTLALGSGTLALGSAVPVLTLQYAGEVLGGTLTGAASGLLAQGGTLSGTTVNGVLALTQSNASLNIDGGLKLAGTGGSGSGSIALSGAGSQFTVQDSESFDNLNIAIGAAGGFATFEGGQAGSVLTLGMHATIQQTGAYAALQTSGGTLVNEGQIVASVAGGELLLGGTIVNAGSVAVSNGETLMLQTDSLVNTGSITVTNGALAVGNIDTSQLASVKLVNSTLQITGLLTDTGEVLAAGPGSSHPGVKVGGGIIGGTVHDGGGVQFVGNAALLDGVTYQGNLAVNRPLTMLTVIDGLTLQSLNGQLPGTLLLTGAGSLLSWASTQALDNATVRIGSAAMSYQGHALPAASIVSGSYRFSATPVLQLGAHLAVQQAGAYADIGGVVGGYGLLDSSQGMVVSAASFTNAVAHGQMALAGARFSSSGSIAVSNGGTVTASASAFVNSGSISVGAGSALNLDLYNYFLDGSLDDASFTNTGSIALAGGSINELTSGGTFPNVPLRNSGSIVGAGTINSQVNNIGTIEANGGTLTLSQTVLGVGALKVDAGAALMLNGIVASGEVASFSGAGVLGLAPAGFLGSIGGFAAGDTIDLLHTTATAAAFSANKLVVTLANGSTIRLTTTAALTGALSVHAGTQGDTLVTFAAAVSGHDARAAAPAHMPEPAVTHGSWHDLAHAAPLWHQLSHALS